MRVPGRRPIRVVLVDGHRVLLDALAHRIGLEEDFEVVGTAADTDSARKMVADLRPDVAVVEVATPGHGAFVLAGELAAETPEVKLLFLSGHVSDVFLAQALKANAAGYILKCEPVAALLEHLRRVHAGERRFSPKLAERLRCDTRGHLSVASDDCLGSLSLRQLDVLRQLACGRSVKEVAGALGQSPRAIESQKYRIMQQLGLRDRVELARFAIREGLTAP